MEGAAYTAMAVEHGPTESSAGPLRAEASPFMLGQGVFKPGQGIPEVGAVLRPVAPASLRKGQ